jgi:hypothetical protein
LAYCEQDDVLALTTTGGEILAEARTDRNGTSWSAFRLSASRSIWIRARAREPDLWREGGQRLQRLLWLHLLPCYHLVFVFNQLGDLERCALRPGRPQRRGLARGTVEPAIARYRGTVKRRHFRGDVALANPEVQQMSYLPLPKDAQTGDPCLTNTRNWE